ncbi:MAG TPA: hypothetical protein VNP93_00330 [Gaiellaceae bacterium]|nr:hypothetical protein [Gaiellaceae bacterium]
MLRRALFLLCLLGLALPGSALAGGGHYVFDGGTPRQQAQVRAALQTSSFDWNVVKRQVTIHVGAYGTSRSTPGHVWLDGGLLDTGRFAWATVMDEYAHQVDFFVLQAEHRSLLREELGAQAWCYELSGLAHGAYGCERFSSMLAWAYWPSQQSSYRPESRSDESASMPAVEFRALLADLIGAPRTLASVEQPKSKRR